jgi:SpoVK/Ycf46/Vps4 family AAA+-type ATPase
VVEIGGKKTTAAIAWPAYVKDQGADLIRMDGIIRRNAQISLEDKVTIRRAEVKVARTVVLAPTEYVPLDFGFEVFVKRKLLGYPVTAHDTVLIPILGRALPFVVNSTNPPDVVALITDTTRLKVSEKPISELDTLGRDRISYEDIGGLGDAILRIREMVELPLKHPELFLKLGIDPPKGVLLHGPPGTGKTLLAKAVANESEAHFIPIQGPEIMSKFYGECVAEDSLVFTNGSGLKSIGETIREDTAHSIMGLNFESGEIDILSIEEKFDKGIQDTLRIITPHGRIEVTPSSRLLTLHDGRPVWTYADELTVGDQIASPRKVAIRNAKIPNLLTYLPDRTLLGGSLVKRLFLKASGYGKNKIMAQKLGITQRRYEDLKYGGRKVPAKYLKKLFSLFPEKEQNILLLGHNRKIPLFMTEELMYILGLLAGDGHLRYSHSAGTVTQVILTNKDLAVQNRYSEAVKSAFGIDLKQNPRYPESTYFDSRPIGDLLSNLGIPYSEKSAKIRVSPFIFTVPDQMLGSYLQGLFDADGGIQFTTESKKKGRAIQITYYSKSKALVMGVKLCLLRFGIISTLRLRPRDNIWVLTISDVASISKFRKHISFTHESRLEKLKQESKTAWISPKYDRIPVGRWIYEIGKEVKITHRELLRHGINPAVRGLTVEQLQKAYRLLRKKGIDQEKLNLIQKLLDLQIIWTPIRNIEKNKAHVYDFEVPNHHNYIANGLIVHNSEARLREIFKEAEENAPSIVFIDEIDAIAPKREEVTGEVERRVVAQILALMDGLQSRGEVIVIGASNRPNALDSALRRPGRFDREIEIGVPDKNERFEILQIHTRRVPGIEDVDLEQLATITHGFVGADLAALAREAAMKSLREHLPNIDLEAETIPADILEALKVETRHFESALKEIQPSAIREVFLEVPTVKWSDIGGLEEPKQELIETVEWPLRDREAFERIGIEPPRGILLYGPPGCGKTLLAKAVANESQANFISIKGPELISKWVGESEKAIREVFRKSRLSAPAIVFFDEIDSIAHRRGSGDSTLVNERVMSQLLTELDGLEPLRDIVVIGATNRPDIIDSALLRPGRFDRLIPIPAPDENTRKKILELHLSTMKLDEDVDINRLVESTNSFAGADIEGLCREAGMMALREDLKATTVKHRHFETALKKVHGSLTEEILRWFEDLEKKLRRRGAGLKTTTSPIFG